MNKLTKRIAACLLAVGMCVSFSGCNKNTGTPWFNEDGTLKTLTKSELPMTEGYYIKRGDSFYRLLSHGYSKLSDSTDIIWYTKEYENYAPTMKDGDELIYINSSNRPTSTEFKNFTDAGYTIGFPFKVTKKENNYEISTPESSDFCPDSPVQSYISNSIWDKADVRIVEINNKPFTTSKLDDYGFMHNLTDNAMYKLSYYMGTVYSSVNVKADTHVYVYNSSYTTTSYTAQKDVFYTVTLPENLPNGVYAIEGQWFRYENENNVYIPSDIADTLAQDQDKNAENPEGQENNTENTEPNTNPNEETPSDNTPSETQSETQPESNENSTPA